MRINKFIASSGFCARRKADELIDEGRVKINNKVAEKGQEVTDKDIVTVDKERISVVENKVYFMLNKPRGYLSAVEDSRKKVVNELIDCEERIFPIGRLDYDTEGLLILTNDGELFNRLAHPSSKVTKKYFVVLEGKVLIENLEEIEKGIFLEGERNKTLESKISNVKYYLNETSLEIEIVEGRNRQIRRMFSHFGNRVKFLKRLSIANLSLGNLRVGEYRKLTVKEVKYLYNL